MRSSKTFLLKFSTVGIYNSRLIPNSFYLDIITKSLIIIFLHTLFTSCLIGQNSYNQEFDKIFIPGGLFIMGNDSGEIQERPAHEVFIDDFFLKKTEVTFNEYDLFCEEMFIPKPPDFGWGRGNKPVIMINYYDAKSFCNWLSNRTGKIIRLPTEAEYEYVSMDANYKSKFIYAGSDNIDDVACYYKNSGFETCSVATKNPNLLG